MALCELKTRGFIEIIERLLKYQGVAVDSERQYCESGPYQVEKIGDLLTVTTKGQIVLEMQGPRPTSNQLTPRDLLHIAQIAAKLPSNP